MSKDIKYIDLVRKLHWAEQNFLAHIPIDKLSFVFDTNVAWEQLENLHLNPGLTKLQQIELTRLKNIRMDIYLEINELLGNEEFLKFVKEYMAMDKDTLEPKNPIGCYNTSGEMLGKLIKHQTMNTIPIDSMPVTYKVLSHNPVCEDNEEEAYRVEINSVETTLNYDCYFIMEYVRKHYPLEKPFHFKNLLYDLEIKKNITSDYQGKPNKLFARNEIALAHLFEYIGKPKGYWKCRVAFYKDTPNQ
tara:strand:+ start:382 stop:1119 length:738 start_codon:yes stop_codon:yes gene_type:complete